MHLKYADCVCLCSREWSPCSWPEIQTSPTSCRGSYQSLQTSTCQLRLFSDRSHLTVVYGPSDTSKGVDRNTSDAYATISSPVQTPVGTPEHAGWPSRGWWESVLDGGPGKRCMGQDLNYNTVIVYFNADDLIGFSPSNPKSGEREAPCVCGVFACVSLWIYVLTWVWVWVCSGHLSRPLSLCGSEKSWLLMGEVIKSGVVVTFPLQGEVQSQPKVVGGQGTPPLSIPPPVPPPSPPPCAWGVWAWVGARALDASLWTLCSGRGHLACLHNGIISVPASATAAVSTSCPSASTSCPWRSSTNCPPSERALKRSWAAGRQSCCINVCGWHSWELHNVFAGSFVLSYEAVVLV